MHRWILRTGTLARKLATRAWVSRVEGDSCIHMAACRMDVDIRRTGIQLIVAGWGLAAASAVQASTESAALSEASDITEPPAKRVCLLEKRWAGWYIMSPNPGHSIRLRNSLYRPSFGSRHPRGPLSFPPLVLRTEYSVLSTPYSVRSTECRPSLAVCTTALSGGLGQWTLRVRAWETERGL